MGQAMPYPMSEQDREIQATARSFMDELIPHERYAELGGGGFTTFQQFLVQEQAGRVTNALGWVIHTPASWLPDVATDEQMDRWVIPTIRGEKRECYAITEEGAGSDVDGITATARREGDEYVLNGVKWHVTSFNQSEYVFFQAKLASGPHAGRHAMFIMDIETPGIRIVRVPAYTHTIAHHHPIVAFEDVRVPSSHLIGTEGNAMHFAYEWFRYERLMIAARSLGAAERLIEEATAFAKDRSAYGHRIIEYQAIQSMLADSLTELWAARLMGYRTAQGVDEGEDEKIQHAQCSMAKLYASEMANRVADRAVQIFGGRGYMRENVAERLNRELRVDRIWEGTSEIQRLIIADQLAKRGVDTLLG